MGRTPLSGPPHYRDDSLPQYLPALDSPSSELAFVETLRPLNQEICFWNFRSGFSNTLRKMILTEREGYEHPFAIQIHAGQNVICGRRCSKTRRFILLPEMVNDEPRGPYVASERASHRLEST